MALNSVLEIYRRKMRSLERRKKQRRAIAQVKRYPVVEHKRPHGLAKPLIVSLTSFGERFSTLDLTLKSLLDQSVAYDRLILWVSPDDRALLPERITALQGNCFEIGVTRDIRSFTKLIPTLVHYPEAYIVTADDDIYYPPDWLETLLSGMAQNPSGVIARRAHMASVDSSGTTALYADWGHAVSETQDPRAGRALFPTGVGGVLYPPAVFDAEVLNERAFLELCPYADDVWFFWMELLSGVQRTRIGAAKKFIAWPSTQESGLLNQNLHLGRNDAQIRAVEKRYGTLESFIGRYGDRTAP